MRLLLAFSVFVVSSGNLILAEEVKLSVAKVCHDESSQWYLRTKNYVSFPDMDSCIKFGRPYSGYKSDVDNVSTHVEEYTRETPQAYERGLYGGWKDFDFDCQNTRQEVLSNLSTVAVTWDDSGCTVQRGRWIDPYTDRIFYDAPQLDIDHLVPLAYAHEHGASLWSSKLRADFANDLRNLFAVESSINQGKGSKGPTEWLPPNEDFRCQYLLRFDRVMKIYELEYYTAEKREVQTLREQYCGS